MVKPDSKFLGSYWKFYRRELLSKTPIELVPELLDALSEVKPVCSNNFISEIKPLEELVFQGIENWEDNFSCKRLIAWLSILLDEHGYYLISNPGKEFIRRWFEKHIDVIMDIWLNEINFRSPTAFRNSEVNIMQLVQYCNPPSDLGVWLLHVASHKKNETLRDELIFTAMNYLFLVLDYDSIFSITQKCCTRYPKLTNTIDKSLSSTIPEYKRNRVAQQKAIELEAIIEKNSRLKSFNESKESIQAGQNIQLLYFITLSSKGLYADVVGESKEERISNYLSQEWIGIFERGALAVLEKDDLPSPYEIGKSAAENKEYRVQYPFLEGMDLLTKKNPTRLYSLSPHTIMCAIAFSANDDPNEYEEWMSILFKVNEDLVINALRQFWEPQLEQHKEHIISLDLLSYAHWTQPFAAKIAFDLLKKYNAISQNYEKRLIKVVLESTFPNKLAELCELKLFAEDGEINETWLVVAFFLEPQNLENKFLDYFDGEDKIINLAVIIDDFNKFLPSLPLTVKGVIITLLGKISTPEWGNGGLVTGRDRARSQVENLLEQISKIQDENASKILHELFENSYIKPWHTTIAHFIEKNSEIRRKALHNPPTIEHVRSTLSGGSPANLEDFFALIVDNLEDLSDDISNGPDNLHHLFWSNAEDKKLRRPCIENSCRNRVATLLKHKLRPMKIGISREDNYRDDKRADLEFSHMGMKIPLEAKRHYNSELWTSIENQLIVKYSRDPAAQGYGIYLVFWFGAQKGRELPKLPKDVKRPKTAKELALELRKTIPKGYEHKIKIVCLDLT